MSPDAKRLLELLKDPMRERSVYRARDDTWWVTYGGGQFPDFAVQQLIDAGHIHDCYSDLPNQSYHVGKTLDTTRTLAVRKHFRRTKDAPLIYVGDPPHEKEQPA